jgi:hypothetical protein
MVITNIVTEVHWAQSVVTELQGRHKTVSYQVVVLVVQTFYPGSIGILPLVILIVVLIALR